ncbi:aromatic ring-hydroxylating oxygenase subunit alpha [Gloeobacter morelensis]|uniref:Aromatic ring-hydroxylating dioxygenase subunit alpha n=1 Tax=Gloeobacter morelensis MG652769 TaxID=2781736 RepID=A0ABY3PGX7_9CYAN|nr:aromatic ring-hydroxylating dioxygenase subunit alpha [Gloeobacter morelensis]UFP92910.1 aromatic ring-hydroxylating dioxygenase subunit alpha [Gloeobacter morelensis MG652769]
MTTFEKARLQSSERTLPGRYCTDPAIFDREQCEIFARRWVCVGRAEQAGGPGEYFLAQVAGESLMVIRDHQGVLRAFYNLCRHRGTRLCSATAGRFTALVRCPYHAWSYRPDGSLAAAPNMEQSPDFNPADYPLHRCHLAEWEGFVWLNLASQPTPFESVFAPLIGRFGAWQLSALRLGARVTYDLRANWKLIFENYNECYHCPPIHPRLAQLSPSDSGRNDLMEGPFLGGYMGIHPGMALTVSGSRSRPPLGSVAGEDLQRAYYYTLFPNLLFSLHPDYAMVHFLVPLAPDSTRIVCEWYFDPTQIAQPGFDPTDAVALWDEINRQDWQVCEWTQQGVASRAYTPGPYAHSEGLCAAFDREYLKALGC